MSPSSSGPQSLRNVRFEMTFETRVPGGVPFLGHLSGQQGLKLKRGIFLQLLDREAFRGVQPYFLDPTNPRHEKPLQLSLDRWGRIAPMNPRSDVPATAQALSCGIEAINASRHQAGLGPVGPLGDWGTQCTFIPKPPAHEERISQRLELEGEPYVVKFPGGVYDRISLPSVVITPQLVLCFESDSYHEWPEEAGATGARRKKPK